ncbi:hypothetical protein D3C87_1560570 [compost metagenome]
MAIQLLMPAQDLLLQRIDQETAVAALPSQRQMLAETTILSREITDAVGLAVPLQSLQREGKLLPFGHVPMFEKALLHAGPNKPRAMPLSSATACGAGT